MLQSKMDVSTDVFFAYLCGNPGLFERFVDFVSYAGEHKHDPCRTAFLGHYGEIVCARGIHKRYSTHPQNTHLGLPSYELGYLFEAVGNAEEEGALDLKNLYSLGYF